jgi:hypothetical protein
VARGGALVGALDQAVGGRGPLAVPVVDAAVADPFDRLLALAEVRAAVGRLEQRPVPNASDIGFSLRKDMGRGETLSNAVGFARCGRRVARGAGD